MKQVFTEARGDMSVSSTEDLIEFWNRCLLSGPRFYHPDDGPYLDLKPKSIDTDAMNFEQFMESRRFGNFKDRRFHLSLLPIPFMGDLRRADIIILLLNPGFEYADYWAETHSAQYKTRLESNLRQIFDDISFPFLCLDPDFCWHPGFNWWEKKLRDVISVIAAERFGGSYLSALRSLAQRLAAVELVPYHSQSFDAHSLLPTLPSACAAKRYVELTLVPAAQRGEKTIVVTRQVKSWGLNRESEFVRIYKGGHTRGASLSPKSDGGKAILRRYKIASA